ncbi:MAG: ubiquinone/menaquinone biosynthesis methyltransferase [Candidatus Omnitrophica bacterium]|nr:ubiquinone/menaquinone biosynthesis methyltransferase [Candidatus Omnitrophota bacterium]
MDSHKNPDSATIRTMFDRLAERYDLFNHLTSLGMATGWRRETLKPVRPGMRVLDLGCGTGDLMLEAIPLAGLEGEVVGLDFSPNMLAVARRRVEQMEPNEYAPVRFVEDKAENLPIEDKPYDVVVSGFVLRNLYENIDKVLEGVFRSLKTGGQVSFLDITEPDQKGWLLLWQTYMNTMVALYGKLLFGKDYPAFYLTESARRFLKAGEFVQKLKETGFQNIRVKSFMFGAVRLYQAKK